MSKYPQVNKDHYSGKKYDDLSRFISYFYQLDLAREFSEPDSKILEIGKGNGFFSGYMKKNGYQVTTCDFDRNLSPDIVADVRSLPVSDNSFDLVTAFEILEHIPYEDLSKALGELKRVAKRHAIISLPYRSSVLEFILKFPGIRTIFKKPFLDFAFRIPLKFGGIKVSKQHYWEIDGWKWSLGKVRKKIEEHFKIVKEIRPPLNHYHQFFVLGKK